MRKGSHLTEAQRALQSAVHMGQRRGPRGPLTPEHRAAISAGKKGRSVRQPPHSPDTRRALSAAKKGHSTSPEHREKLRIAGMGNTNARNAPIKGECVYCGAPAQTYDHVIPRGRPGWDDPDNVVPACYWCNTSKKDRTPEEWFATG